MKWKDKRLRAAAWILGMLLFAAIARDLLANGRPLYCRLGGQDFFPGLRTVWAGTDRPYRDSVLNRLFVTESWKTAPYERAIFAPIPFSPNEFTRDMESKRMRPGTRHPGYARTFRHWLGTDSNGRDVAAVLIGGARVAVITGVTAMALAFIVGLFFGSVAGYFGDDRLRLPRAALWLGVLALPLAWYYAIDAPWASPTSAGWRLAAFALVEVIAVAIGIGLGRLSPALGRRVTVPADLMIMRLAEIFNALPRLIVVIAFMALLERPDRTIGVMIALIGLMSWVSVAKYIRAELLRVRALDFVTAAHGLGFTDVRILLRHAIPNSLRSALITVAFGVGGAIVLEASLSYLGIGGGRMNATSWGALLESARTTPSDWWVVLPAGMAIGFTVLGLHLLGEALSEKQ